VDDLTKLAHCARDGDKQALDAFVRAGHAQVWRLCAALVDAQSADDLTQETFLRAVSALRRFRGESTARTWLLAIAKRACFDELRSRRRRRRRDSELAPDIAALTASSTAPDVAHEVIVRDALSKLDPDRRAAWVLTQMLRMSYADAAIVCDCPTGTIRSRVARAREDLMSALVEPNVNARSEQAR
jgi:RNA polymerase sigma-70 factor (ECF subfamily)